MSATTVPVLLYHSVSDGAGATAGRYTVSRRAFADHVGRIAASGRTALTVSELGACLRGERALPERAVAVTFDDGFADVLPAVQRLAEAGIASTVYVATGALGTSGRLSRYALAQLARVPGCEVGAHSVHHPRLDVLTQPRLSAEVGGSRAELEDVLQQEVRTFAYPHGAYDRRARAAVVAAGFRSAAAVRNALSHAADDPFAIARWTVTARATAARLGDVLEGRRIAVAPRRERRRTRAFRAVRRAAAARRSRRGPLACVIGSIDLVRPLGLAGIPCAVVAHPTNVARFSRHTKAVVEWADPDARPDDLVARLLAFAAGEPEPPVLLYEGDAELLLISRRRERLRPAFRFSMPDAERVEELVDKARFRTLAARLGLPVPASAVVASAADLRDSGLRFPVLLKPHVRQTALWDPVAGGAKAIRLDDPGDLRAVEGPLRDSGLAVLAQELVDGPETRIESYHVYVDADGRVAAEFCGRKIRTRPADFGRSTAVEITAEADVRELGRELTARLGLRGPAKLDFKRDPAGRLWLLEVNPRFTLWHHPAALAGVNVPELAFRDLVGLPRRSPGPARAGVRWVYRDEDARAAREAGIGLRHWLRWALSAEAVSGVAPDDPLPLVRGVLTLVGERVRGRAGG